MFFEYIKNYEKSSILINIIMVVVSLLLIINPAGILNFVMLVFSTGIIIDGFFKIISYFTTERENRIFSGNLFQGIITITAGLFLLINKELLISMLPIVIGIWVIIRSVMKLQLAFNLKSIDSGKWLYMLISAIISLLLGVLVIANPFGTVVTVTIITGIILLISSIVDLIESLVILKTLK